MNYQDLEIWKKASSLFKRIKELRAKESHINLYDYNLAVSLSAKLLKYLIDGFEDTSTLKLENSLKSMILILLELGSIVSKSDFFDKIDLNEKHEVYISIREIEFEAMGMLKNLKKYKKDSRKEKKSKKKETKLEV